MNPMTKPKFAEINLIRFNELNYKSVSHTFNKAVVASYNNVARYGFEETDDYILSRRGAGAAERRYAFAVRSFTFLASPLIPLCFQGGARPNPGSASGSRIARGRWGSARGFLA